MPVDLNQAKDDAKALASAAKNQPTASIGGNTAPSASGQQPGGSSSPAQTQTTGGQADKPGKRTYNPLGKYASYTYTISLYMIRPDAYNSFILTGRKKLNLAPGEGTVLICQSGGINRSVQQAADGFSLDYYIDDLKIKTYSSGKDTQTSSNTTNISFKVVEPYGFSFLSNLRRAADKLISESKGKASQNQSNAIRQFFILGIRFTGFDLEGKPITKDEKDGDLPANYERFYDIMFYKFKFDLSGGATTYFIEAATMQPSLAFGTKRGVWETGGKLKGVTVYDMLTDMCKQLSDQSKELFKGQANVKPNKYNFKFVGPGVGSSDAEQKSSPIFASRMKTEADVNKSKLTGTKPLTTSTSTPEAEQQAVPQEPFNELTIPPGTPILQAIQLIISRSDYITNAFKVIQTNALENEKKNEDKQINKTTDASGKIKWYNLSANCQNPEFIPSINDYTWDITYVFEVYETPIIDNAYSNLGTGYYGPHKRYDYWFTGKNSEIISYKQTLNNGYFTVTVLAPPDPDNPTTTSTPPTPVAPGIQSDIQRTDTQNQEDTAKNAYLTSLYDPEAYAKATIKILGDPDFLMPDSTSSVNAVYNKFYGVDGATVKANGGQVFVEIDFKEGQDYNYNTKDGLKYEPTDDGLMSINDKIQFWNYPKAVLAAGVKGVSYMVLSVNSSFSGGKFEQDLDLVINTFPGYKEKKETTGSPSDAATSGTPQATGLMTSKPPTSVASVTVSPSGKLLVGAQANAGPRNDDFNPPLNVGQTAKVDVGAAFRANTSPGNIFGGGGRG